MQLFTACPESFSFIEEGIYILFPTESEVFSSGETAPLPLMTYTCERNVNVKAETRSDTCDDSLKASGLKQIHIKNVEQLSLFGCKKICKQNPILAGFRRRNFIDPDPTSDRNSWHTKATTAF